MQHIWILGLHSEYALFEIKYSYKQDVLIIIAIVFYLPILMFYLLSSKSEV